MRRDDNRWTRRVTEWQPRNGKRTRGRHERKWRAHNYMGPTWPRLAQDRQTWQYRERVHSVADGHSQVR